jgi:hypothetical protein
MESSAEAVDSSTGTTRMQLGLDNSKRGVEIRVLHYGSVESCERCPAAVHSGERAYPGSRAIARGGGRRGRPCAFQTCRDSARLGKEGRDSDWAHRDSSSDHDTARRYRRRRPSENRGRSHQAGAGNGRTMILSEGSVRPRFSDAVTLGKRCAGGGDRRYLAFASTGQN